MNTNPTIANTPVPPLEHASGGHSATGAAALNAQSHTGIQGSPRGLLISTLISAAVALVLLVTVVLPAEYNIDPTGIGRVLGLTQMGEIKEQLSAEAAADAAAAEAASRTAVPSPQVLERLDAIEQRLGEIAARLDAPAAGPPAVPEGAAPPTAAAMPGTGTREIAVIPETAATPETATLPQAGTLPSAEPAEQVPPAPTPGPAWRDEVSFVLAPGQGIELKLVMNEGAVAEFEWSANGAVLNHDTHGDGGGRSVSYEKGRNVSGQSDQLVAAFTGKHGWFFRNRTNADVSLTLRVRGDYAELVRTA